MSEKLGAQADLESKRARFTGPDKKTGPVKLLVAGALVVILAAAAYVVVRGIGIGDSTSSNAINESADAIQIPVVAFTDGKAQFIDYKLSNGTQVRFFALQSADGKYRAAMDACDTCYHAKRGYRQDGDVMICNNCGMRFQNNLINEVKGGCNPVGLACAVEGKQLVIKKSELESRRNYFQ